MLVRLRAAALAPLFVLLSACASRAVMLATPSAPAPIPVAAPSPYTADRTRAEGLEDLCKIDPEACPSLDMARDASRTVGYALSQSDSKLSDGPQILLTGPLSSATAVRKVRGYGYAAEEEDGGGGGAPVPPPPDPIPVKAAQAATVEQLDIEVRVQLEVSDMANARHSLLALLEASGGQIMNEVLENSAGQRGASFSLRVPSKDVKPFLAKLGQVGKVLSSKLETREVSRALGDAAVVLRNLEQALTRYEQLLAKAANVAEATALETELMRVRSALDRVKSDIAWQKGRVARSTVYLTLSLAAPEAETVPLAKFYPGVRAALLIDVPATSTGIGKKTFGGGGISLQFTRAFDLDLDLLNDLTEARGTSVDFYALTLGTALYSDYLGAGKRRALNPYFGFRTGYAHAPHQSLFPLGGVLGLELLKSEYLLFSLEARAYALIGRKQGPDFALEPALGLNVAY
ncbi:MAG TPA: DUF4349 domain-containing protein [Polyangiaceae bacterium]|nr:DUF4349 domain-containing protein [Polyangiaceae bacterium]